MQNYMICEVIGDIAGSAYEDKGNRIKDYNKVKMFSSRAHFTDDTWQTFACTEVFIDHLDMTMNLWKCANEHRHAGFSSTFKKWFASHNSQPYRSLMDPLCAFICRIAGTKKITWTASNSPYLLVAMQIPLPLLQAFWQKPDALVYQAIKKLPDWMVDVSERYDEVVNSK